MFGVSYPTVKARLNRIAGQLEFVDTDPKPLAQRSSGPAGARRDQRRRRHPATGGTNERRNPAAARRHRACQARAAGVSASGCGCRCSCSGCCLLPLLILALPLLFIASLIFRDQPLALAMRAAIRRAGRVRAAPESRWTIAAPASSSSCTERTNAMNDNRRQILDMLAQGKITADEAERLIAALERGERDPAARNGKFKYLRVLVDANDPLDGPTKVNVRVPMQLLRAGVKLTGVIPDTRARRGQRRAAQGRHRFRHQQVTPRESGRADRAAARSHGRCR